MEFRELGQKLLFKNNHISVITKKLQLPTHKIVDWTFLERRDAVAVIAVLDNKKLVLVKQYRPAIGKCTIEIPAGVLEPGEVPIEAAKRELEEETGYRAVNLEKVYEYYMSPGVSESKFYIYYADKLEKGVQNLDEDEFVEIKELSLEEIELLEKYLTLDGKTILGIEYAKKKLGK